MPDRLVRVGILSSDSVNRLSWGGEVFYRRLMSVADDYGCYDGRAAVLKAALYPIKLDRVSDADVGKWLTECVNAGLVSGYTVEGRVYVRLNKFKQRLQGKPKWPLPDENDIHGEKPPYSETDSESRKRERANADAWIERIREAYPRKGEQQDCRYAIRTAIDAALQTPEQILADVKECAKWVMQAEANGTCSFVPSAGSFFCKRQWTDPKKFEGIAINAKRAHDEHKSKTPKRRDSGDLNSDDRYA